MEELVILVDENTDYFRAHLETLPSVERRVYTALLDLWQPSTAREVADRARIDIRTASSLLGRLQTRGFVVVDQTASKKRKIFRIAEPLYSIYYKVRRERDESAVVENLINFMIAFYDVPQIFELFEAMSGETPRSYSLVAGIDRVLANWSHAHEDGLDSVKQGLIESSRTYRNQAHLEASKKLQKRISQSFENENWVQIRQLVDEYVRSQLVLDLHEMTELESTTLDYMKSFASFMMNDDEFVIECGNRIIAQSIPTDEVLQKLCLGILAMSSESARKLNELNQMSVFANHLIQRYDEFPVKKSEAVIALTLVELARATKEISGNSQALVVIDDLLRRFGSSEDQQVKRFVALGLHVRLEVEFESSDDDGILQTCELLTDVMQDVDTLVSRRLLGVAFMYRAFVYAGNLDFEAEISSYRETYLLFHDIDNERSRRIRISMLGYICLRQSELGLVSEATKSCEEAESLLHNTSAEDDSWEFTHYQLSCARTLLLLTQGDAKGAINAFRCIYSGIPIDGNITINSILRHVFNFIARGAPVAALLNVILENTDRSEELTPLVVALRQICGESVRAPVEILSIAEDIRDHIINKSQKGVVTAFSY